MFTGGAKLRFCFPFQLFAALKTRPAGLVAITSLGNGNIQICAVLKLTFAKKSKTRKRAGRPNLPPENLKTREMKVRFSAPDFAMVKSNAFACGMTMAAYLHVLSTTVKPIKISVPAEISQLLSHQIRQGNNLNQVAKAANSGSQIPNADLLPEILTHQKIVHKLLLEIVGEDDS